MKSVAFLGKVQTDCISMTNGEKKIPTAQRGGIPRGSFPTCRSAITGSEEIRNTNGLLMPATSKNGVAFKNLKRIPGRGIQ